MHFDCDSYFSYTDTISDEELRFMLEDFLDDFINTCVKDCIRIDSVRLENYEEHGSYAIRILYIDDEKSFERYGLCHVMNIFIKEDYFNLIKKTKWKFEDFRVEVSLLNGSATLSLLTSGEKFLKDI